MFKQTTAIAHSNIALVKYWGKRDQRLNLPSVGSISLTLDALTTTTSVKFDPEIESDRLTIGGVPAEPDKTGRVSALLDIIRHQAGLAFYARVDSANNFPTGAGLASSASAFAALAYAGATAAGLNPDKKELSILARQGSGSAARSIYGGFVEMHRGMRNDGLDAWAQQIAEPSFWDVRMIIAITDEQEKKTGSTSGMTSSAGTSPYYPAWVETSVSDIGGMRAAVLKKDISKVGEIAEYSCMKMHAVMLSSNPALIYWNGTTVDIFHQVREMRGKNIPAWFTVDAGPQVKILTLPEYVTQVEKTIRAMKGVKRIIGSGPGPDACLSDETHAG